MIDLPVPFGLLGAHVVRRAENRARSRLRRRPETAPGVLCDAEVENLRDLFVVVLDQKDIVRLEIAVNDARPVRARHGAPDLVRMFAVCSMGIRPACSMRCARLSPSSSSIAMKGTPSCTP